MSDLALVGPTGTGKTALGAALWRRVGELELVSVDAMAVYRGMRVGTDQPASGAAPWHLVGIAEPSEEFSVARFQSAAAEAVDGIHSRGRAAVLVGGTGLYHRAVMDDLELPGRFPEVAAVLLAEAGRPGGLDQLYERLRTLDPVAASRIEPGNERRVVRALEVTIGGGRRFSSFGDGLERYEPSRVTMVGLRFDRAELDRRLTVRLDEQLAAGFLEEAAALARRPGGLSRTARQAIGYAELTAVADGQLSLDEAKVVIVRRLKSFARRQESWFRRDPRVTWFDAARPDLTEQVVSFWAAAGGAARTWETARS